MLIQADGDDQYKSFDQRGRPLEERGADTAGMGPEREEPIDKGQRGLHGLPHHQGPRRDQLQPVRDWATGTGGMRYVSWNSWA
jgi:hypothetical protein